MRSLTGWYQNLKKWQKGGLIGCAVGIIFASFTIQGTGGGLGGWIFNFHAIFFIMFHGIVTEYSSRFMADYGGYVYVYGGSLAVVIFYGGLGAILGKIQQIHNPLWKWSLTALLALFLLLFYVSHTL